MKISQSFISNSSSSSFILYGFELESADWAEIAKTHFPKIYKRYSDRDELDELYEIRSEIFEEMNSKSDGMLNYISEDNLFGFKLASDIECIGLESINVSKLMEYEETLKKISKKLFGDIEIETKLYYGTEST
jgi:hypothetical protein